jgi:hypothetical protein
VLSPVRRCFLNQDNCWFVGKCWIERGRFSRDANFVDLSLVLSIIEGRGMTSVSGLLRAATVAERVYAFDSSVKRSPQPCMRIFEMLRGTTVLALWCATLRPWFLSQKRRVYPVCL